MKKTLHLLGASLLMLSLNVHANEAQACNLDCLLCSQLADPAQYSEGMMKALEVLAPGKDNWLFRSAVDLSNNFGIPAPMVPEFARLMRAFADQGSQVAIFLQPTRGLMHRDKVRPEYAYGFDFALARDNLQRFQEQLRSGGALVPDILPLIDTPPSEEYFFRRDHHWTPAGGRATARIVADFLRRQSLHAQLNPKAYRSELGVMMPKDGTMNRGLRHICGNNYGFQYVRAFQTVPASDDIGALLDDDSEVEVVLVGTSNSAARDDEAKSYNFDGFLKEYLGVDILNYALPGAGQDGALLQYLQSEDYDPANPPRLIIWELPASFRLDNELSYRQLIPAIKGGCASGRSLARRELSAPALQENQRLEIFANTGAGRRDLRDLPAFLELRLGDRDLKDFYVITYYDNGARDKVWYRREAIVDGGLFYLELSRAAQFKGANLLSVFIEPSEAWSKPTSLEFNLCL